MSFPRARVKRFNEELSCAPPVGYYDPKSLDTVKVPSLDTRDDRFKEPKEPCRSRSSSIGSRTGGMSASNSPSLESLNMASSRLSANMSVVGPQAPKQTDKERDLNKQLRQLVGDRNLMYQKLTKKTEELAEAERHLEMALDEKLEAEVQLNALREELQRIKSQLSIEGSSGNLSTSGHELARLAMELTEEKHLRSGRERELRAATERLGRLQENEAETHLEKEELERRHKSLRVRLEAELESKDGLIKGLEVSLRERSAGLERERIEVGRLRLELERLDEMLKRVEEEARKEEELEGVAAGQVAELLAKVAALEKEKRETVAEIEGKMAALSVETESIRERLEDEKRELRATATVEAEHSRRLERELTEAAEARRGLEAELERLEVEWKIRRLDLETESSRKDELLREAGNELDAERMRCLLLEGRLEEKSAENEVAETRLAGLKREHSSCSERIAALEARLEEAGREIAGWNEARVGLERRAEEAATEAARSDQLERELVEAVEARRGLETELERLKVEWKICRLDLEKESGRKDELLREAENELDSKRRQHLLLEGRLAEKSAENEVAVTRLASLKRDHCSGLERIAALEGKLEEAGREIAGWREAWIGLERRAEEAETRLANEERRCAQLMNSLVGMEQAYQERVYLLEQEMRRLQEENAGICAERSRLVDERQSLVSELQEMLASRDRDKKDLMTHLEAEMSRKRKSLEDKAAKLKADCDRWKNLYEEQSEKIEPFKHLLEKYELEKQVLLNRTETAQKEVDALSSKYAESIGHQNHRQKIQHVIKLKQENIELKETIAKLQAKDTMNRKRIEKLTGQLESLEGKKRFDPATAFGLNKNPSTEIGDPSGDRRVTFEVSRSNRLGDAAKGQMAEAGARDKDQPLLSSYRVLREKGQL